MTYDYRLPHIRRLKRRAMHSKMSLPAGFESATLRTLQRCYNGIGPDRWSKCFRKLTTWLLTFLETPALIHDWEYTFQPKTYWCFTLSNLRLAYNALIDGTPFSGIAAGIICQLFGWHGYKHGGIEK